jgi:hypothetical protein
MDDQADQASQPQADNVSPPINDNTNDALSLLDLERTIKTFHQGLMAKREELRKLKEMIDDTLENDQVYAEHTEKVNDAKRLQKETRDQLMGVSSVISTLEEMKELRNDVKELQQHLSDNIIRYYEVAKTDRITMDDGESYVIKTSAKLVKESSQYRP